MSTTSRLIRLADLAEERSIRPRFPPPVERTISIGGVALYVALLLFNAWSWYTRSDGYQETHGDAKLAHPSPTDCEIARTIVADAHSTGRDRQMLRSLGDANLSLQTSAFAWDQPGALPAGYLATGADADWRWCAGLGRYVRSVGWVRLGDWRRQMSTIWMTRPAFDAAEGSAVVFEFATSDPLSRLSTDRRRAFEGDLVFLNKDPRNGNWTITGRRPAN